MPLGWILTYYDGSQPQYAHLNASMLGYAHINLLSMLTRFTQKEAVRVATDSICILKEALRKLDKVKAYIAPQKCDCGKYMCGACLLGTKYQPPVTPAQLRDKGEQLYMAQEHAAYLPKPGYERQQKDLSRSTTAPRYDDHLTRHQLSYLNGGGGSGKTTGAIDLFRVRDPLVFTPTHRLAKEM